VEHEWEPKGVAKIETGDGCPPDLFGGATVTLRKGGTIRKRKFDNQLTVMCDI